MPSEHIRVWVTKPIQCDWGLYMCDWRRPKKDFHTEMSSNWRIYCYLFLLQVLLFFSNLILFRIYLDFDNCPSNVEQKKVLDHALNSVVVSLYSPLIWKNILVFFFVFHAIAVFDEYRLFSRLPLNFGFSVVSLLLDSRYALLAVAAQKWCCVFLRGFISAGTWCQHVP